MLKRMKITWEVFGNENNLFLLQSSEKLSRQRSTSL